MEHTNQNYIEILDVCRDYAVVYKPYGALSEKSAGDAANVPDLIENELSRLGIPYESIHTVHRLDRTTAGVMVYALTKKAAAELSRLIADDKMKKTYAAYITKGEELPEIGEMRDMLFFDRRSDKSFVVNGSRKGAKEAVLTYEIQKSGTVDGAPVSLAHIRLQTGRTHQIRVQFASRHSPLLGDKKYGSRISHRGPSLFSIELRFPWRGEEKVYAAPSPMLFDDEWILY